MIDDASHPITLRRLEKLNASVKQLLIDNGNYKKRLSNRDDPLVAKIRRLEKALETSEQREVARENILIAITAERDHLANKKEAENASSPPTQKSVHGSG